MMRDEGDRGEAHLSAQIDGPGRRWNNGGETQAETIDTGQRAGAVGDGGERDCVELQSSNKSASLLR